MKYSKDNLSDLDYKHYVLLIAEELNDNGFKQKDGNTYKVATNVHGDFVSDFSRGFITSIDDVKAIEFLKEIGLLNNGRCPLTGLMYSEVSKYNYTSENNSSIYFEINREWFDYIKVKRNWGCLLSPIIIVGTVIWGCITNFNTISYTMLASGVLILILSVLYGGANFGNNWNKICLSNQLGVNTVTLYRLMKIADSKEGICSKTQIENEIANGDSGVFTRWYYSNDYYKS